MSPNPKIIQSSESDATYLPPRLPPACPKFTEHNWVCSIPSGGDTICDLLRMLVDITWAMWGKVWSGHSPSNSSYYFFPHLLFKRLMSSSVQSTTECTYGSWKIITNSVCRILSLLAMSHEFRWLLYQKDSFTEISYWQLLSNWKSSVKFLPRPCKQWVNLSTWFGHWDWKLESPQSFV